MKQGKITMTDVAARAGVSQATVSYVLNGAKTKVSISAATREKIMRAVAETGYHPNAAARSLSMSRTNNIGFILSDNVTDGLANAFFSQQLAGVEQACRNRGYGLHVSLYNLSNLDSFVFPSKVGQRSVDGLVLGGYVEAAVIQKFKDFGIPCICIGDNTEVAELIPTVAIDLLDGLCQAAEHAVNLGYRRIGICSEPTRRGQEVVATFRAQVKASPRLAGCEIDNIRIPNARNDYSDAKPLVDYWLSLSEDHRPQMLLATDQTLIAAVGEFHKAGIKCPEDISLLSICDSTLCKHCYPGISAISCDYVAMACEAAEMLIEHLGNKGKVFGPSLSRNNFPCRIIQRGSCVASNVE